MLDTELHIHLYGCLTAQHLWNLGRDRHQKFSEKLEWFESEFQKASKINIDHKRFWNQNDGFEYLKKTYEMKTAAPFAVFQAKFNLAIALFPVDPDDMTVLKTVATEHATQGLKYCEYRTFLPPYLTAEQNFTFVKKLCESAEKLNADLKPFSFSIALGLQRDHVILEKQYELLKSWIAADERIKKYITGIDFAGYDEVFDPRDLKIFFEKFHHDKKKNIHQLKCLMHAGETWETLSPLEVIDRVEILVDYGVDRIGHATVLGAPQRLFQVDVEKRQLEVLDKIKEKKVIIESCPTSNLMISGIKDPNDLPIKKFLELNMPIVISTDDPGIFGITLADEEAFVASLGKPKLQ